VDLETDALVQDVLRSSLGDRTVITIAHRIETILSADRVFVMAAGKAVETGKPRELLMDMTSAFSKHVNKN
jgi:ATP-binding cassette subfamily C (CFTR/MRP) protein 1